MKKKIIYTLILLLTSVFWSCEEEALSPESVIVDVTTEQNELDTWIHENYNVPYNINFIYRADDREYDMDHTLAPPTYEHSIAVAKLLLHMWLGTLDDVKGPDFTKTYIPKTIMLVGSGMYNSTTVTIGEAEGGMKITFARVNALDLEGLTLPILTGGTDYAGNGTESTGMLKTAFHEFSHIMTQTKALPEEFSLITANAYLGDDWSTVGTTAIAAWEAGFPTKYARHSPGEDFAEITAVYITRGSENWDALITHAGETGAGILNIKVEMINKYLKTSWGTSLEELRDRFEARAAQLDELDLTNING